MEGLSINEIFIFIFLKHLLITQVGWLTLPKALSSQFADQL
jgi:hypothetical protein